MAEDKGGSENSGTTPSPSEAAEILRTEKEAKVDPKGFKQYLKDVDEVNKERAKQGKPEI